MLYWLPIEFIRYYFRHIPTKPSSSCYFIYSTSQPNHSMVRMPTEPEKACPFILITGNFPGSGGAHGTDRCMVERLERANPARLTLHQARRPGETACQTRSAHILTGLSLGFPLGAFQTTCHALVLLKDSVPKQYGRELEPCVYLGGH
jgi:hypothetical protein